MAELGAGPMKVHSLVIMDIETGAIINRVSENYTGPVILCVRELTQQAENAGNQATQQAGQYGSTASQVGANLIPQLERESINAPGYSPIDLGNMQTQALTTGAAKSGAAREAATLRAARTGNAAALPGQEAAINEAGARASGGLLQNILSKNAQLKAQQQAQAQKGLEGIYGTAARAQGEEAGLVPHDIDAATEANKTGWLQDTMGALGTLGNLGSGAGSAMSGYAKLFG